MRTWRTCSPPPAMRLRQFLNISGCWRSDPISRRHISGWGWCCSSSIVYMRRNCISRPRPTVPIQRSRRRPDACLRSSTVNREQVSEGAREQGTGLSAASTALTLKRTKMRIRIRALLLLLSTLAWAQDRTPSQQAQQKTTQAKNSPHRATTYCNPLNLDYTYKITESDKDISYRSGADPAVVGFRGDYYMFVTRALGYWYSHDLTEWHFITPQR